MKNKDLIKNLFLRVGIIDSIKEIVILCWGYPLYLISFLFPRHKKKLVFGNKSGFSDNTKYLYLYLLENSNSQCYWITVTRKQEEELRKKGINAYYRFGLRGFYHCATSKYFVFSITCNHLNYWVSGGASLVNLWHGVGIKSVKNGNKSLFARNILSRIIMPHAYKTPSLFLSTSPLMNTHFQKQLSIPSEVIFEGMYPRCSFIQQSEKAVLNHIRHFESDEYNTVVNSLSVYSKVYIYMPTWRGDLSTNFLEKAFPDIQKLNTVLRKNNSLLILKLHPNILLKKTQYEQYDSILYLDPKMDIYPLLPFTQVLVTDYSSIYYDYLLIGDKEIILYPFDEEKYNDEDYPFSFDYDVYTPGLRVKSFDRILSVIEDNVDCKVEEREWVLSQFWGDYRNKDQKQLYDKINSL